MENLVMERNNAVRPRFIDPMLCKPIQTLPERDGWFYEVKQDGCRAIAVKDGENVALFSRRGDPLHYPEAKEALRGLNAKRAVIDCELVALNQQGQACREALGAKRRGCTIHLYAFDLLHLNGRDLMGEPIENRKERLCTITLDSSMLFAPSLRCEPDTLVEQVAELSLGGVVAKRKGSTYEPGKRTGAWVMMRVNQPTAVFVGGLAAPPLSP
jgi:bifunctional non-homologous end joining protein LigD